MAAPELVVMAAGMGSRYGGLKQIDPVGPSGEIIIDYSIFDAIKAGFEKVIFIIRKEIEADFRECVGDRFKGIIEVDYAFQELSMVPQSITVPEGRVKPWGTGHAVLCAKDVISAPFAVINADDFYGASSFQAIGDYLRNAADNDKYDYSMVGFILENTISEHGHVARGCCEVQNGKLASIIERTKIQKFDDAIKYSEDDGETWTDISPKTVVSMNMWGFTPGFLDELSERFEKFVQANIENLKCEFFIPLAVDQLMSENKAEVSVLPCDGKWLGVTYREDKPTVQAAIAKLVNDGEYPEKLWA